MNAERFESLADAYGGDIAKWPEAEQGAARALRSTHREAAAVLAEAGSLDVFLNAADSYTPNLMLMAKVVKSAVPHSPRRGPAIARPRAWISGAALAAACAAGVILGANFSDRLLADPVSETFSQTATAFDGASYFATTESAG